jgi:hypothetical protein
VRDITDDIGKVVERMRPLDIKYGQPMLDYLDSLNTRAENYELMPFYDFGHRLEIANKLKDANTDKVRKYQKYPLVALRMDVLEHNEGGMTHYNLNIAFLAYTDRNYTSQQRMEKVIKPVLMPLYDRFMQEIRKTSIFTFHGNGSKPIHDKAIRPFWGIQYEEGNKASIFEDPLDAIEILNLKVSTTGVKC